MSVEKVVTRLKNGKKSITFKLSLKQFNRRICRSFKRRVDAETWETIQKARLLEGHDIIQQNSRLPLVEAVEMWFREHVDIETSLGYARRVKQQFKKHIIPHFGNCDLRKINSQTILAFRSFLLAQGLTKETVTTVLKTFSTMLNHHVEEERIMRNPIRKKHYFKTGYKDEYVWDLEECRHFLNYTKEKYRFRHRRIYIIYKIAANTGARWGEIVVLEKDDFDFKNRRIRVAKAYCRDTKGTKRPKNGKIRYAPLSDELTNDIQNYFKFCRIGKRLFTDKEGGYFSYNTFRNVHYLNDVKEAKIQYTKFHNLRRFYITAFLENGGSEAILRQIVGHRDFRMTDRYTHLGSDFSQFAKVVHI